ncbi:MAG: tetratricopeptide repeat protein [Treponema sp.]|nr:tetratricopeptide repeat protein [Treponema sp.]
MSFRVRGIRPPGQTRRAAFLLLVFFILLPLSSCRTVGPGTPIPSEPANKTDEESPVKPQGTGIADEIRRLTESGIYSQMLQAIDIIRNQNLGATEFGRVMNAVNVTLIKKLYPDGTVSLPPVDFPQVHTYTKIIRDADQGKYTQPPASSNDYLELVLPFLALSNETQPNPLIAALADLHRAYNLRPDAVLAPYFSGTVYEKTGNYPEAVTEYSRAWDISDECYPAALALARVYTAMGNTADALKLLSDLVIRYPDNVSVKRQYAIALYTSGDWSRAEPAIAEILQRNGRDGEFLLMRAAILIEQGHYIQAQTPLDTYASILPSNRQYLFLRARIQAEGYHNRDAALNYLRSILRTDPSDDEVSVYAAQLLMESPRTDDQAEGRELFRRLLAQPNPSPAVLSLGLQDAIYRESWREAQGYLSRLLDVRRSTQDLFNAYTVERGLGNNARALAYARELYERDTTNDAGVIAYISALIDTGRIDEAGKMIEGRLAAVPGGAQKSRYYYLRSRIMTGEDAVMNDLRSSLFEDPRNLDALTAMFEIYNRRRDERRAVYYLKQALAISPDNPKLKRYEAEYASMLGN